MEDQTMNWSRRIRSRVLPSKRPVPDQNDHRAQDRADQPGRRELSIAGGDRLDDEATEDRADEPEDERPQEAHRVAAGHEQARERSRDETHHDPRNDVHRMPPLQGSALAIRRVPGRRRFETQRARWTRPRSEEHTSELQSLTNLVCRLLLEKKK